jgi:hypothetical protein
MLIMSVHVSAFQRLYDAFHAQTRKRRGRPHDAAVADWYREAANALVCACVVPENALTDLVGNDAINRLIDSYKPEAASLSVVRDKGEGL